jgi:hypothetical protein
MLLISRRGGSKGDPACMLPADGFFSFFPALHVVVTCRELIFSLWLHMVAPGHRVCLIVSFYLSNSAGMMPSLGS